MLPLPLLRELDIDGNLEIGKLKVLISGDIEACRGLMALLDALLKNR